MSRSCRSQPRSQHPTFGKSARLTLMIGRLIMASERRRSPQAEPPVPAMPRSDTTGTGEQRTILTVSYDGPLRAAARLSLGIRMWAPGDGNLRLGNGPLLPMTALVVHGRCSRLVGSWRRSRGHVTRVGSQELFREEPCRRDATARGAALFGWCDSASVSAPRRLSERSAP